MEKIKTLYKDISDEELKEAILEIQSVEISGIIPDGIIRKYSKLVSSNFLG